MIKFFLTLEKLILYIYRAKISYNLAHNVSVEYEAVILCRDYILLT